MQIEVTVNALPIKAVVNTGAEATVISEEVYNMLPIETLKPLTETSLRNAGFGSKMSAMGKLEVMLGTGSRKGLDTMQAVDMTVLAGCKAFLGNDPVPFWVTEGNGEDYSVARVLLEDNITLPPESECLVWGKVENPKPGLPAVLEPLDITETVSSGSVAIYMDPRIPVRLCNFLTPKHPCPTVFVLVS